MPKSAIIGNSTMLVECITTLKNNDISVSNVFSDQINVKEFCKKNDINCETIEASRIIEFTRSESIDLLVNIANPLRLPNEVIQQEGLKVIQFHDSLIPGHDEIHSANYAILNDANEHGCTWFEVNADSNPKTILNQYKVPIDSSDTAHSLNLKTYQAGIHSFNQIVEKYCQTGDFVCIDLCSCKNQELKLKEFPNAGLLNYSNTVESFERTIKSLNMGHYPNSIGLARISIRGRVFDVISIKEKMASENLAGVNLLGVGPSSLKIQVGNVLFDLNISLVNPEQKDFLLSISKDLIEKKVIPIDNLQITGEVLKLFNKSAKEEDYWLEKLKHYSGVQILNRDLRENNKFDSLFLENNSHWERLASIIVASFAQVQEGNSILCSDDFLSKRSLVELDMFVPFFPVSIDFHGNSQLVDLSTQIKEKIQKTREKAPIQKNILLRYPILIGKTWDNFKSDVLIHFGYFSEAFEKHIISHVNPSIILIVGSKNVEIRVKSSKEEFLVDYFFKRLKTRLVDYLEKDLWLQKLTIKSFMAPEKIESNTLLKDFNDTEMDYRSNALIKTLFEEQVRKTPNKIAVIFGEKKLSYQELNRRSNQFARTLRQLGVGPDSMVGVMLSRSLDMIIGIFAILKAGGAYVPIDPLYPEKRVQYIMEDSGTKVLLSQSDIDVKYGGLEHRINLDTENVYHGNADDLDDLGHARNLAYVIYTSGSTGAPKGLMTENKQLHHFIFAMKNDLPFTKDDRFLIVTSISFDPFGLELFLPLVNGNTTVLASENDQRDPALLKTIIEKNKVTVVQKTTGTIHGLLENGAVQDVRLVLVGGEALSENLLREIQKATSADIFNLYGPTETTGWASVERLTSKKWVTIGKPVRNTRFYILNEEKELCPIGIQGELYISGDGLARGYLNRPQLTKERFIENPYEENALMYRTGDLARWLPDGTVDFLGRKDHQVKIRGYRIELGEVENVFASLEGVEDSVVLALERNEEKYLVGYYKSEKSFSTGYLRKELGSVLPEYMVPSSFIHMSDFPLTPNGKIDRKALPEPVGNLNTGVDYIPPSGELEIQLAQIFQDLLGLDKVGINDDFFSLGGHSLKATSLVSKIHKLINIQISLQDVFNNPKIKDLAEYINGLNINRYHTIPRLIDQPHYQVSSAQRRLFLVDQIEGSSISYNIPNTIEITGRLDVSLLNNAFSKLLQRHESFRTYFEMVEGEVVQKIAKEIYFDFNVHHCTEAEARKEITKSIEPFDLKVPPLFRVSLYIIEDEKSLLMFDIHHIISDGVSMSIMQEELFNLYEGKELPGTPITYKDFASWQNDFFQTKSALEQRTHWENVFSDQIPVLNMPTDHSRPTIQNTEGAHIEYKISADLTNRLNDLALRNGATLYMVLLGAYYVLLNKYTNQEDIIVGTPIAGRRHAELEQVIGMFVNTLALRNYPTKEKTFEELLKDIRYRVLKDFDNQDYPFEDLVDFLGVSRDISRNPVFDTMFAFHNIDEINKDFTDIRLKNYDIKYNVSKFDFMLTTLEAKSELSFDIEYSTKLFNRTTMDLFLQRYIQVLKEITKDSNSKISEINILLSDEKQKILKSFNATKRLYPQEKMIHEMFEEQVRQNPERVAIVYKEKTLTFYELNEKANQIARVLKKNGVGPNVLVPILVHRSLEMMIGIFGILKAGGAYVPIDPNYPSKRIQFILEDTDAKIILTQTEYIPKVDFEGITLDLNNLSHYQGDSSNLQKDGSSRDLAYVIYTSGSTGKPKGVMIEHYSVINRLSWMNNSYPLTVDSTLLQKTPFTFDVSVWELFWWSFFGAKLVILPQGEEKSPVEIVKIIEAEKVTTIHFVPSMFNAFLDQLKEEHIDLKKLESLGYIFNSGEALKNEQVDLFDRIFKDQKVKLVNLYGPTEATVDVSYFDCYNWSSGRVPIGKPIDNIQLLILTPSDGICPIGIPGELCISGDGLARGYLNRPELTLEKFIEDPKLEFERFYRTGDLARWLPDGNIEYLGRMDHQVKIRGYRIELGEIEQQLLELEDVKEAVVISRKDNNDNLILCAYLVLENQVTVKVLRNYLMNCLPSYMVPSFFVEIDKIPLTSNGKIDRKSLPEPVDFLSSGIEYVAPRNEVETTLVKIWRELLGVEKVGVHDDFFAIGGNSIISLRLISRTNSIFQSNVKMKDIYLNPRISELAKCIETGVESELLLQMQQGLEEIEQTKKVILDSESYRELLPQDFEDIYPLSKIQQGMVFFSQLKPDEPIYHDQFLYNFHFERFDFEIFKDAMVVLSEKNPILRTSFDLESFLQFFQIVHKENRIDRILYEDISTLTKESTDLEITRFLQEDTKNKYMIHDEFMWRMKLFRISEKKYTLVFSFHHGVLDGWSVAYLISELLGIYDQLQSNVIVEATSPAFSYKKYVAINISSIIPENVSTFWKHYLKDHSRSRLPFNFLRQRLNDMKGSKIVRRQIDGTLLDKIKDLAVSYHCTVKDILFSAHLYLMSIITGENDLITGIVSHDRPELRDSEKVLGCFLNTLPVRYRIDEEQSIETFLKEVTKQLKEISVNSLFLSDIAGLVGDVNKEGNPLFDTLFNFTDFRDAVKVQNENSTSSFTEVLDIESNEMTNTLFDLEASIVENGIAMQIKYAPQYFYPENIETAYEVYLAILDGFVHTPKEFSLSNLRPTNSLLHNINNTKKVFPDQMTLSTLFERQVERSPNGIALIFEGENITYKDLNRMANRLAHRILDSDIKLGEPVAIISKRGFGMIVGILGILKAGGAYVPIDPQYPDERKSYIIDNSKISKIVSDIDYGLPGYTNILIEASKSPEYLETNPKSRKNSEHLAYVIYTSGSTGVPKGVMIEEKSIMNLIHWVNTTFNVNESDRLLFITSMCFDLSVYDIFGMLCAGGSIVIVEEEKVKNPLELAQLLKRFKVTFWDSVPTSMKFLVDSLQKLGQEYIQKDLRLVFMSGDWIPVSLPKTILDFFPNAAPISLGGATEGTVWSNYYPIDINTEYRNSIPYGRPIDNTQFYILDDSKRIQPDGVAGELYIGGVGVARGYMNDKKKSDYSFVTDPFRPEFKNIYRTGDYGRMLPDGNIEFLGRIDNQVKIRGFRIELGEIEHQLVQSQNVEEAIVVPLDDGSGNKYLCAYVVSKGSVTISELRSHLMGTLPDYMIPTHFVELEELPITANGKIDRKNLPDPDGSISIGTDYVAPRDEIEKRLAEIWSEILGVRNIGIRDNFFELGGNSLQATHFATHFHKEFEIKLGIAEIFQNPTIEQIKEEVIDSKVLGSEDFDLLLNSIEEFE